MSSCAPVIPIARANPEPRAWGDLVRENEVHGSLYTDPAIFEEELRKIWFRTWVYVGHESEVPQPNDYVMKSIGPEPILMTRDREGGGAPPHVVPVLPLLRQEVLPRPAG